MVNSTTRSGRPVARSSPDTWWRTEHEDNFDKAHDQVSGQEGGCVHESGSGNRRYKCWCENPFLAPPLAGILPATPQTAEDSFRSASNMDTRQPRRHRPNVSPLHIGCGSTLEKCCLPSCDPSIPIGINLNSNEKRHAGCPMEQSDLLVSIVGTLEQLRVAGLFVP